MVREARMRRATDGLAVGGLTMPAWFPSLEHVSQGAALAVPILSALWLAVQIVRFLWQWRKDAGVRK